MNRCAQLRDQLEEVALGGPRSPALLAHLTECADCSSELDRQRAFMQRIDAAIHAVVRAEPPPGLPAGIAARLATGHRVPGSTGGRFRIAAWAGVAAACAAIFAIGFSALERPAAPHSELSALVAWHSPTASLLDLRASGIAPRPSPQHTPGGTRDS